MPVSDIRLWLAGATRNPTAGAGTRRVGARTGVAAGIVALALAATIAVGLGVAKKIPPADGYDAQALLSYAEIMKSENRLPTEAESYEFTTPPAYPWLAVQLQRLVDATGGWLGPWRIGQLLSIAWMIGLVAVTWLLAREALPGRRIAAALAVVATAAIPIVLRLGVMFHPEMQFAFFALLAVLLVVRAERRRWSVGWGVATGVALGLAALTRPTAAAIMLALGLAVLLAGRRRALLFALVAAAAILAVAGAWWVRQVDRYGNPLESNLDRYILQGGQPLRFYVSAPLGDLVLHPYRPHFAGELWPQFHADLWSDWFGAQHRYWPRPPEGATAGFVSAQSVLGLVLTPLALGGLVAFGGAGAVRLWQRRGRPPDFAYAAFLLLAAVSWAGFIVNLVRFPQGGGDPIKASYMLYLAPVFAISGIAAADHLWRRALGWRVALASLGTLCLASYVGYLVTAYPS